MNNSPKVKFAIKSQGLRIPIRCRWHVGTRSTNYIKEISTKHDLAVVGGSDLTKIHKQLGDTIYLFKYVCTENGLVTYVNTETEKLKKFYTRKINEELGEEKLKNLINFFLKTISEIDIPIKRGCFVEYRTGLINVSPIGRNCSLEERLSFHEFNKKEKVLEKFKSLCEEKFAREYNLKFSIGGQISFDVFPIGWDKTYCLRFFEGFYKNIYFFGDKTYEGGNDFEIYTDKRVNGVAVLNPEDTVSKLDSIIKSISN